MIPTLDFYRLYLITSGTYLPGEGGLIHAEYSMYADLRRLLPNPVTQVLFGTGLRHAKMRSAMQLLNVRGEAHEALGTQNVQSLSSMDDDRRETICRLLVGLKRNAAVLTDPITAQVLGCTLAKERSVYLVTIPSSLRLQFEPLSVDPLHHGDQPVA